jgi:hypothetical protein
MRSLTIAIRSLLLVAYLGAGGDASAHGGEDHGDAAAAPASVPGVDADLLTTSGATEQFELLLKYAPPRVGQDARVRLFLADYATNRAVGDAAFALAFKPAGVGIVRAPAMISPGIYEAVLRFPRDTVYSLVATVTAGGRTDFLEARNIYAGDAATRFIAEHSGRAAPPAPAAASGMPWPIIAGIVIVVLLAAGAAIVAARRMRLKRPAKTG